MIAVPLLTLLNRIVEVIDQDIVPGLPPGHLRARARGIASILNNVAGRVEERCSMICQENQELRGALVSFTKLLDEKAQQKELKETIEALLETEIQHSQPVDENYILKEGLTNVIKVLPELQLSKEEESRTIQLIYPVLRNQIDRDKSLRRPTRIGRVSSKE